MNAKRVLISVLCLSLISWPTSTLAQAEISDPLESYNRGMHWFNEKFDDYVLEPTARGYDRLLPQAVKKGVSNFLDNLTAPKQIVNSLLQLKFKQGLEFSGRFIVNSTFGVAGFLEVAEDLGLPAPHSEDFGLTLAHYNVPPGPYTVLPFLGPSNLRDSLGKAADFFLSPTFLIRSADLHSKEEDWISYSYLAIDSIDTRYRLLEAVETAKEASLDYYLFMQSSYYQYREGLLYDGSPPEPSDDDWLEDDLE